MKMSRYRRNGGKSRGGRRARARGMGMFSFVHEGQSGTVIPVAVMVLAILFLIGMLIITVGIGELSMTTTSKYSMSAFRIAEAGVSRAMNQLRNDLDLTSAATSDLTKLNWPNQELADPPVPTTIHRAAFGGGEYEVWLYQDPLTTVHSKKVIVSEGEYTSGGTTYRRVIETKVNFADNTNALDAFNFLVYQGDDPSVGLTGGEKFSVRNQFGSYNLDGVGDSYWECDKCGWKVYWVNKPGACPMAGCPNTGDDWIKRGGDGWGIYSKGPIELSSEGLGWDCNIIGNVISEDCVRVGSTLTAASAPPEVYGTVYAGIDGVDDNDPPVPKPGEHLDEPFDSLLMGDLSACGANPGGAPGGACVVDYDLSYLAIGQLTINKIYAASGVSVRTFWASDSLTPWGAIQIPGGIESGGNVKFLGVMSNSVIPLLGGIHIGEGGKGSTRGVKARGKVDVIMLSTGISIGDIEAGYDNAGTRVGVALNAAWNSTLKTGSIKSTGKVWAAGALGTITIGSLDGVWAWPPINWTPRHIWAGTDTGASGGSGTSFEGNAVVGGLLTGDIVAAGKVSVLAGLGGFGVGNVYSGYKEEGSYWSCDNCGYKAYQEDAPGDCLTVDCPNTGQGATNYWTDHKCWQCSKCNYLVDSSAEPDYQCPTDGCPNTGSDPNYWVEKHYWECDKTKNGDCCGTRLYQTNHPAMCPNTDCDGTAWTHATGVAQRMGTLLRAYAGYYTAGNINSFGKVDSTVGVGGSGIGNINAGTEAVSGDGSTGVDLYILLGGGGAGNIMSRGKVNVNVCTGAQTVGSITAGTDAGIHGETGVNVQTSWLGSCTTGAIVSRGMVNLLPGAGWITVNGAITAGTSNPALSGGLGVNMNASLATINVTGQITSTGPVKAVASWGAGWGITTNGIWAGEDTDNSNEGFGINLIANAGCKIKDTGELKCPSSVKLYACVYGSLEVKEVWAGNANGGTGLLCKSDYSDGGGDVIKASGLVKTRGKIRVETYGTNTRFNGGIEAGSDATGTGFDIMMGGWSYGVNAYLSNNEHFNCYGKIAHNLKPDLGHAWFCPHNLWCGTDVDLDNNDSTGDDDGFSEKCNPSGYVRTPGYVNFSWEKESDKFYYRNVDGDFKRDLTEVWCGGDFKIKPKQDPGVNLSDGVRSRGTVMVDTWGKNFCASSVKANALAWSLNDGGFYIGAGGIESQADVNFEGGAVLQVEGALKSSGNIFISHANDNWTFGGIETQGNFSGDAQNNRPITLGNVKCNTIARVGNNVGNVWLLDEGKWDVTSLECQNAFDFDGDPNKKLNSGWFRVSGDLRAKGDVSLLLESSANPGFQVLGKLISGAKTTIISGSGDEKFKFGSVYGQTGVDFWMEDAGTTFTITGDPAIQSGGNINLNADGELRANINWEGGLISAGNVYIDTWDTNVNVGCIYSKKLPTVNLNDGNWTINPNSAYTYGIVTQRSDGGALNLIANKANRTTRIYNGVYAGGTGTVNFWNKANDCCLKLDSGGIKTQGNVDIYYPNVTKELVVNHDARINGGIDANGFISYHNDSNNEDWKNLVCGGMLSGSTIDVDTLDTNGDKKMYIWGDICATTSITLRATKNEADNESLNVLITDDPLVGATAKAPSVALLDPADGAYKNGVWVNKEEGEYNHPDVATPPDDLFDYPTDALGMNFALPTAPTLPDLPSAPDLPGAPPAPPAPPALPSFGGTLPAFPDMVGAVGALPAWMGFDADDIVSTTSGGTGKVPGIPPLPTWPAVEGVTQTRPDFANMLPFGQAGKVKIPTPQWDWWREEAKKDEAATGKTHYWPVDADISVLPTENISTDEVYFAEGDVTINALDFPNDSVIHEAHIVAYGNITVKEDSAVWKIYENQELHLIANNNIELMPTGWGTLTVGTNAICQFWAGRKIEISMSIFSGILGSGYVRGNLIAGENVLLKDPFNVFGSTFGWYNYKYLRPEINSDGWLVPYRATSWRELTNRPWTDATTPAG